MTLDELDSLAAENWKPINGFPGYEISNIGQIRSYRHKSGILDKSKILKLCKTSNGKYFGVSLINAEGKNKYRLVHNLVLRTFNGEPQAGHICCHNDGNGKNNHISNLRWDTHKGNHFDKWRHGTMLHGENANSAKLSEKDVEVIRYLISRKSRQCDICRLFGVHRSTIERIANGKNWGNSTAIKAKGIEL